MTIKEFCDMHKKRGCNPLYLGIRQAAEDLNVPYITLYRWYHKLSKPNQYSREFLKQRGIES